MRVVDELEQVAVTGHDVDGHDSPVAVGQRADDVVGLEPGRAEAGDPEGAQCLADQRHLRCEVVG